MTESHEGMFNKQCLSDEDMDGYQGIVFKKMDTTDAELPLVVTEFFEVDAMPENQGSFES